MDKSFDSGSFMEDARAREYFDSLPPFVQETIMQGGKRLATFEELRDCAENILRREQ